MDDLIIAAKAAGADVVKFQWTSDPDRMAARRHVGPEYLEHYRKYLAWPEGWHRGLAERCAQLQIEYACTVYLPEDVARVDPFVKRHKVSAFEASDMLMFRAVIDTKKYVVVSIGATHVIPIQWVSHPFRSQCSLLHCVSAYPAPLNEMRLRYLRDSPSGPYSGLSDHSGHVMMGSWAVAVGARCVEAHLKLEDTNHENLDAGAHALTPSEFQMYCGLIRDVEDAIGDGGDRRTIAACEEEMSRYHVKDER